MTEYRLKADIIGYDSGWGCRAFACENGPDAVRGDQILHLLAQRGVHAKWRGSMGLKFLGDHKKLTQKIDTLPLVREGVQRLCNFSQKTISQGSIPIVIGGDHCSAIGTWSGITAGLQAQQRFGLIWIDAHMDAHTPETSSQGKWGGWWHGQPLAVLLGKGEDQLTRIGGIGPKLAPQHITLLGYHSYEPGEEEFLKQCQVCLISLPEIKQYSFAKAFSEALNRATQGTRGFGLSIDLDSFHVEDAPGVGTPEKDGLRADEVLTVLHGVAQKPGFCGLEIAEYNPSQDIDRKTSRLIERLIASVFAI